MGGVEDADVEVGVGDAAEVGLEAEVLEGVAIDGGRGHQGDGEDDADGDGGHQSPVAVEPTHGDSERGRKGAKDAGHAALCCLVLRPLPSSGNGGMFDRLAFVDY